MAAAGIPLVAVDMPHPHATYFGADNYRIGYAAGEALARYAFKHWKSQVSWVLGLDMEQAGEFVQNRTTGAFNGIHTLFPDLAIESFVRMDSVAFATRVTSSFWSFSRAIQKTGDPDSGA